MGVADLENTRRKRNPIAPADWIHQAGAQLSSLMATSFFRVRASLEKTAAIGRCRVPGDPSEPVPEMIPEASRTQYRNRSCRL